MNFFLGQVGLLLFGFTPEEPVGWYFFFFVRAFHTHPTAESWELRSPGWGPVPARYWLWVMPLRFPLLLFIFDLPSLYTLHHLQAKTLDLVVGTRVCTFCDLGNNGIHERTKPSDILVFLDINMGSNPNAGAQRTQPGSQNIGILP